MSVQECLWQAAAKGDKVTIRALVFEDVDFDLRDEQDRTAFNIATQYGHADAAQTLLAAKQMKSLQRMGLISSGFEAVTKQQTRQKTA